LLVSVAMIISSSHHHLMISSPPFERAGRERERERERETGALAGVSRPKETEEETPTRTHRDVPLQRLVILFQTCQRTWQRGVCVGVGCAVGAGDSVGGGRKKPRQLVRMPSSRSGRGSSAATAPQQSGVYSVHAVCINDSQPSSDRNRM